MSARSAGGWGAVVALMVTCLVAGEGAPAARAAESTDMTVDELLGDTLSSEAWAARMQKAVAAAEKTRSGAPLIEPLDLLIHNAELFVAPETMTVFADALLKYGNAGELASRVPRLVKFAQTESSPTAIGKFNLGIKLAMVHGGASFDELRGLLKAPNVDLEWLLPALGKTGGAAALPLIRPYQGDAAKGPPNDPQTMAPVSCAAVLAAAYAGDAAALTRILDWYDEDVANLPRFAFYVAYGLQEGQNVKSAKRGVAYCEQRIAQAERLLDFLGRPCLPRLMERVNRDGSLAVTGYLVKAMERAKGDQIPDYFDLFNHPAPAIKERVLDRIMASGDAALKARVIALLRAMVTAPAGTDRLFAVTSLLTLQPADGQAILEQACAKETNAAVRVRMENMLLARSELRGQAQPVAP